ncbi:hypothetical protein, partial [Deinococcus sp. 23YEL01]|uniref:hypothetical protein n=1 Tax=Deinococcus sp. 23YEL01 TaxID=2745871 RepID=UPI001E50C47A
RVSRRHEMPSRTPPSIALCGFLSVRTAFFVSRPPASRTTRHPTPVAFSYFDRQMLVSGLFRLRRAYHGQKPPPERNGENDVLTDVSPSLCSHDVVWHATPAGVETLDLMLATEGHGRVPPELSIQQKTRHGDAGREAILDDVDHFLSRCTVRIALCMQGL